MTQGDTGAGLGAGMWNEGRQELLPEDSSWERERVLEESPPGKVTSGVVGIDSKC